MAPKSPAPTASQVSGLNRARDLRDKLAQGSERLVFSLCGNVYQCLTGIANPEADLEPAPSRDNPKSHNAFAAQNAERERATVLRHYDQTLTGNPPQLVFHLPADGLMMATPMPGLFVGLQAQHPFQVMYAGGASWLVGAGNLLVDGYDPQAFKDTLLETGEGWICLSTDWAIHGLTDYECTDASLTVVQSLVNQPPEWKMGPAPDFELTVNEGTVLLPLAFVSQNAGGRPLIQQTQFVDLQFVPSVQPWGLTGPRTIPF